MTSPTSLPPAGTITERPGTLDLGDLAQNAVAGWVQRTLSEQPWYKRKSNTITVAAGAVVTVIASSSAFLVGAPEWVQFVVAAIGAIATILATNVTPNGVTPSTGAQLQAAVKDPALINAIAVQLAQTVGVAAAPVVDDVRAQAEALVAQHLRNAQQTVENVLESGRHSRGD